MDTQIVQKQCLYDRIENIKCSILQGEEISRENALSLLQIVSKEKRQTAVDSSIFLERLCQAAQEIRLHFCGNSFDMCAVINGKNGKCTENCKFCAQSSFYDTKIQEHPLLSKELIIKHLKSAQKAGLQGCALVNAGKRASQEELSIMANAFAMFTKGQEQERESKEGVLQKNMHVCASLGLLDVNDFRMLQKNGVTRVHNNLESSEKYFPHICTSHTFEDKIRSIKAAQSCGLMVCSGGIFGLGESLQDRIDMVFTLKKLDIQSVPINILFPIKGTPFEKNSRLSLEEVRALVAVYRFILPRAFIRLAGGRTLLEDKGQCLFEGGANAMISGNMLTISGFSVEDDRKMVRELGFDI